MSCLRQVDDHASLLSLFYFLSACLDNQCCYCFLRLFGHISYSVGLCVCFNIARHTRCWKVRIRNSVCFSIARHIVLTIFDNVFTQCWKVGISPFNYPGGNSQMFEEPWTPS